MRTTLASWVLRFAPVALVALLLLGSAKPVSARPCFTDLGNCWVEAASISPFWFRWAAGLDCELGFISCTRLDLIGR